MRFSHELCKLFPRLAVFTVILVMCSCGGTNYSIPGATPWSTSDTSFTENNLNGFRIITVPFAPDYASAGVAVFGKSGICASQVFAGEAQHTQFSGRCEGSNFSFDILFVPVSGHCQPGGLYIMSGSIRAPGGGPTVYYTNFTLAGWDISGQSVKPWITPFDQPVPISQMGVQQWNGGDIFSTMGAWSFLASYRNGLELPDDCSLVTLLEITLTSADKTVPSRIYHYKVTETNKEEQITADISSTEPNSPAISVEMDRASQSQRTWLITMEGLDFLRDAGVRMEFAFLGPFQILPVSTTFANNVKPTINISREVDITRGDFPKPLATYLTRFFTELTAPLAAISSEMGATVPVRFRVSLSVPLDIGLTRTIILPLIPDSLLIAAMNNRKDCNGQPVADLSHTLALEMKKAAASVGPFNSETSFVLSVTFPDSCKKGSQPLFQMNHAVVPFARLSDYYPN